MTGRQVGCRSNGRGVLLNRQTRQAMCTVFTHCAEEKRNRELLVPLEKLYDRVAGYFEVDRKTLRKVLNNNDGDTPGRKRNRKKTVTGDGVDTFTKEAIRRIVYTAYSKGEVLTLQAILAKAQEPEIGYSGCIESLRTVLRDIGFKYKLNNNRRGLCENEDVMRKKITFLRLYIENLDLPKPLPVVFLDETWLFMHGSHIRSWVDNTGNTCKHLKGSEGRRFIVLHAGSRLGFIPGCELLFASKSNSGDYHNEMNANNFYKWVSEKLIPGLYEPSLIVMDNAPYHSTLLERQPTSAWRIDELQEWLDERNIPYDSSTKRPQLYELCKLHKEPPKFIIDELLASHGHTVLRLPPYHCEYNAIELAWGQCKGFYNKHIGLNRRFGKEMTMATWTEALLQVDGDMWSRNINHTEKLIRGDWIKLMGSEETPRVAPMIINLGDDDDSSECSDGYESSSSNSSSCSSCYSYSSSKSDNSSQFLSCSRTTQNMASPLATELVSPSSAHTEISNPELETRSPSSSPSPAYSPISVIITGTEIVGNRKRKAVSHEQQGTTKRLARPIHSEKSSELASAINVIITSRDPMHPSSPLLLLYPPSEPSYPGPSHSTFSSQVPSVCETSLGNDVQFHTSTPRMQPSQVSLPRQCAATQGAEGHWSSFGGLTQWNSVENESSQSVGHLSLLEQFVDTVGQSDTDGIYENLSSEEFSREQNPQSKNYTTKRDKSVKRMLPF